MRPLRLEIAGFQSFREPTTIELADVGAAAIVGPNRAGKTSLIEAIAWALYGRGRAAGADSVVSHGSSECRVRFEFLIGDVIYAVERQRDRTRAGKSSLEVQRSQVGDEWDPVGGDSIAETQAMIVDLVGMDFETWSLTSWIGQGRADAFTRLRPAERKDLLSSVLSLDLWELMHERAHGLRAKIAGEITATERSLADVDAMLARTEAPDLERLKDELAAAEQRHEQAEARLRAATAAIGAIDIRKAAAREIERLDETIGRCREGLAGKREQAEGATALRDTARELADQAMHFEGLANAAITDALAVTPGAIEAEIDQIERKIAENDLADVTLADGGGLCPTCGQPLDEAGRTARRAALELEVVELGDRRRTLASDLAEAQERARELRAEASRQRQTANDLRGKAGDAAGKANIAERIAGVEIPELEETLRGLERQRSGLGGTIVTETEIRLAEDERRAARGVQIKRRDEERAAVGALAAAEQVAARIDEARALRERTAGAAAGLVSRHGLLSVAEAAFGRDGIPARLIEAAVPEIEDEANAILGGMMGEIHVSLETIKATKTAGNRESLEIIVTDAGEERPLEQLSGAERQSVDLALRLGLSMMLLHKANAAAGLLVIDEGATAFDAEHRQAVPGIIGSLSAFETVLFVTHLADLAEAFPTRIAVSRPAGSSVVEITRGGG